MVEGFECNWYIVGERKLLTLFLLGECENENFDLRLLI